MADSKRDVQLDIAVSTSGAESIKALAVDVAALAKNGGDAAPEFQRLAAELDRIAAQSTAVETFARLKAETAELAAAQSSAAARASELKTELAALTASTRSYADAESTALAEVKAAKTDLESKRDALARMKLEYDETGRSTDEYKQKVRALNTEILDSRIALREAKAGLDEAASATTAAEAAESKLVVTYKAAAKEADAATAQLAERNAALEKSRAVLEAAGVSSEDLAASQGKLVAQFGAVAAEANQLQADVVNLARAEKELAEINAFEQKAAEAKRLQEAAQYVGFWTEALAKEEAAERALKDTNLFEQQVAEAQRLNAAAEYVHFWTEALDKQEAKERELADNKTFEKQIAEAKRLRDAADYVKFWTTTLEQAEAAERQLSEQSARAGAALENAFKSTGIRSAAVIRDEINEIGAALVRLSNNARVSGAEFDQAFASGQARIQKLKNELAGVPDHITAATKSTNVLGEAFRNLAAIYGGFELAKNFVDSNIQMENMRRTLVLITGSSEAAAKQIDFLKKTANDSGVAVGSIAQAYSKFVASAGSAGISLNVVDRAFAAVTKSAGLLGLSSEDTSSALSALGQSASKGKVSLEELQQQLGDRLPAVLATTAKGLGITTSQLTKLIETGKLAADDTYFTAFASGIEQTFLKTGQSVEGLQAQIGRFKNALNEAFVDIGNSGVVDALTDALKRLAPVVGDVSKFTIGVGKSMGEAVGFIAGFGKAILTLDLKGASANIRTLRDDVDNLNQKWFGAPTRAQQAEAVKLMGTLNISYGEAVEKVKANAAAQATAAAALAKTTTATTGASDAQKALAASADAAAVAVKAGTANAAQIAVYYDALIAQSKTRVKGLEEEVQAVKKAGEASVNLAQIGGNEITIRAAVVAAAENNVKVLTALAAEKRKEADLSIAEVNALEVEAKARGGLTETRQKELDAMRLKADAMTAESKKSEEAANLAETEAAKRRLLADTYGDQSSKLDELKLAYERATAAAAAAVEAEKAGLGTKQEAAKALQLAADAEGRYKDALDDTVAALDRKGERAKIALSLTEAQLNLDRANINSEIELAKLQGNSAAELDARIRAKQIEIKIIEAKITATKLEAQAVLAGAEASKVALEAEGKLTEQKKLEIEASIANAKVKMLEADASGTQLKVLQQQIDNLRLYGDESGAARAKSSRGLEGETSALDINTAAHGRNTAAIRENASAAGNFNSSTIERNARVTKESDDADAARADFNHTSVDNTGIFSLQAKKRNGTLSADDLATAQAVYDAAKANLTTYQQNQGAYSKEGADSANGDFNSARQILDEVRSKAGKGSSLLGGTNFAGATPGAGAASGAQTVNININGKKTAVTAASPADAAALTDVLRQLGDAANRTGP